jgi:hypothetical protein
MAWAAADRPRAKSQAGRQRNTAQPARMALRRLSQREMARRSLDKRGTENLFERNELAADGGQYATSINGASAK